MGSVLIKIQICLDFSKHEDVLFSFGIFYVKLSSDGCEIVAGSNDDSLYVYDLHANKLTITFFLVMIPLIFT
jgi:hypothetical protein